MSKRLLLVCCILSIVSTSTSFADERLFDDYTEEIAIVSNPDSEISMKIDSSVFSPTCIRLNTEIYDTASDWFSREEITKDLDGVSSVLLDSYLDVVNPLVPVALTVNETGGWKDTKYTWTSAIYSKPMSDAGADMDNIVIDAVSSETYVVLGLMEYMGCGGNCNASRDSHYHFAGKNDNDSLGSLQVLRHYVESSGSITYPCGEKCTDLMSWKDNVIYFQHSLTDTFKKAGAWCKGKQLRNTEQLVALAGIIHNTGSTFLTKHYEDDAASSNWNTCSAAYRFAEDIATEQNLEIIKAYVEDWYVNAREQAIEGQSFSLPGECGRDVLDALLMRMGVSKLEYASSFEHKQYYPLRAVLNYEALKCLYTSGGE